ncbi:serine/threonine-protein kinase [Streptomyces sp. NPDC090131]|uniref:serine/threonine-protein kinase n=1 Tax=Streptomyces sp. NPDC090131 TaxID=3365954 RepID=UPI00381FC943
MVDTSLSVGVLAVAGPALVVRLLSLPLLLRAQEGVRERVSAARDGRAAPGRAAVVGELVVQLGGGAVLVALLLMLRWSLPGLDMLAEPAAWGQAFPLAIEFGLPLALARTYFVGGAIVAVALWLLLWFLTQRNLLTAGAPAQPGAPSPNGPRTAALLALRVAVGVFAPVGVLLAALVFQAVALIASSRARGRASAGDGLPVTVTPSVAPSIAPSVTPEPAPAATATAPPLAPLTPLVPPAPSFPPVQPAVRPPAQQVPYLPTQADRSTGAVPQVACQELNPNEPRTIAGYQLLGRIGAGGMGTVYLARREGAATQVALKTIHPELLHHAELLLRFEREVEVLSMVSGAYTARVLDAGVDAGRPYLAMELLDGRPLDVHLREQGPIRSPEALRALALALAVALSGVHRLGLVHRDLKPANIMLTTAGPRLLDFGIAALVDGTRLTRTGGGPGTLTYMAPEQFGDERVGTAADVWAWACCVVCAVHGTSPFSATSTGAVIRRIVDTGPEPAALEAVRALDPALAAAVGRALTADPAGRPADGAALVELLTGPQGPDPRLPDAGAVREQITQGWRTLTL